MFNFYLTYKYLWWSRPSGSPRPPPEGLQRHWIETPDGSLEILSAVPSGQSRSVPVFFAHGGMGGAWVWATYMRFLAARGIPCYAISTRGHGESWHPSYLRMVYCTTRRMLSDDLVAGIRWVQDREQSEVLLVGHSSGGGLSQAILSQGDVTVKGLALLGAVPGFGSMGVYMNWARADPCFSIRLLFHGWHPNSPLSHPMLVRRIFFSESMPQQSVLQFASGLNRYESYLWAFSMMFSFADPRKILRQIRNDAKCKVLVLTGSEDKLMTAPIMERLGTFYRGAAAELGEGNLAGNVAEVAFVPGAGHHLQNDTDWEVGARRLLEFYERARQTLRSVVGGIGPSDQQKNPPDKTSEPASILSASSSPTTTGKRPSKQANGRSPCLTRDPAPRPQVVVRVPSQQAKLALPRLSNPIIRLLRRSSVEGMPRNKLADNPSSRLSLVSGHLRPVTASSSSEPSHLQSRNQSTMSSQPEHPTLLIPGPIEFDDAVLHSMSHYSESHVGPAFVATFGETLSLLRKLFQTTDPSAQPFIISGSGTLGWDIVAANLIESGENALVLSSGYFGDSFADCLTTYGANVTKLEGPVGGRPQLPEIEKALSEKKYKLLTVTHVDTSTGVLSELKNLAATVKKVSPETLVIVDGVCSVACEEIAFDEWGLDGVVTASQKAIGCPAGLSISMFSGRAMEVFKNRKSPPASYFASMKNWTPIMQNYEAKKPSYFATPSPQLVRALNTALKQVLAQPLSQRFQKHIEVSDKVKKAVYDLGLEVVATKPEDQAHAMTAIYLPESVQVADILPKLANKGVVFAGGLHKAIATKYIRFGHMGFSVMGAEREHIDKAIDALRSGLSECGYQKA